MSAKPDCAADKRGSKRGRLLFEAVLGTIFSLAQPMTCDENRQNFCLKHISALIEGDSWVA
jgi:hypothetical protein